MSMNTDRRRGESKQLRKDQQTRREILDEVGSEIVQNHLEPQYRNPNRDQARGDRDRTRRLDDSTISRDQGLSGDDGLGPEYRK